MSTQTANNGIQTFIRVCLLAGVIALPSYAFAQGDTAMPKPAVGMGMSCPMMGDANAMQKDLGTMMSDVEDMMKTARTAAMKERLQRMHEKMAVMMAHMEDTGRGSYDGRHDGNDAA